METHGVAYLLTGQAHAVRTLVSIVALRRNYSGPITLFTTREESHAIGELIARDRTLAVSHQVAHELVKVQRKNRQFVTKVSLMRKSPYDVTLYLDGDTLPIGDILPMIELAKELQFCASQFNRWTTAGKMMTKRLNRWKEEVATGDEMSIEDSNRVRRLVDQAFYPPMPAINGGCFAARRDAEILKPWFDLCLMGQKTFICDEIALQMSLREYPSHIIEGGRFNCSAHLTHYTIGEQHYNCPPGDFTATPEVVDPVVLHYHGEKHLNRESSRATWIPVYNVCLEHNYGNIRSWTPANDPSLIKMIEGDDDVSK